MKMMMIPTTSPNGEIGKGVIETIKNLMIRIKVTAILRLLRRKNMNKEAMKEETIETEMGILITRKTGVIEGTIITETTKTISKTEIRAIATITTGMKLKITKKEFKLSRLSKKKKFNVKLNQKGGSAGPKPLSISWKRNFP